MYVSIYVCVLMNACVYADVPALVWTHMWEPEVSFVYHSPEAIYLVLGRQGLSLAWSLLTMLDWLASELQGSMLLQVCATIPSSSCGFWRSISGPCSCRASILPAELLLGSRIYVFMWIICLRLQGHLNSAVIQ